MGKKDSGTSYGLWPSPAHGAFPAIDAPLHVNGARRRVGKSAGPDGQHPVGLPVGIGRDQLALYRAGQAGRERIHRKLQRHAPGGLIRTENGRQVILRFLTFFHVETTLYVVQVKYQQLFCKFRVLRLDRLQDLAVFIIRATGVPR